MRGLFAVIFGFFFLLVIGAAGDWIVEGNDFLLYRFFAPKQEAVRRDVFENTKSYSDGMIQELENMQVEYIRSNKVQQDGMASIILHRAASFDANPANANRMPPDLRAFINQLKDKQLETSVTP